MAAHFFFVFLIEQFLQLEMIINDAGVKKVPTKIETKPRDFDALGFFNVWTNSPDIILSSSFPHRMVYSPFLPPRSIYLISFFGYLVDTDRVLAPYSNEIITEAIVPST